MSDFPVLKTGAVMQYPAQNSSAFSTQVVRFVDGAEQRFRDFAGPVHRWLIKLNALDETEISRISELFRDEAGASGSFTFTDPWSGTTFADCSFEQDELAEEL